MVKNELLIELYCEEIPARMQNNAIKQWEKLFLDKISQKSMRFDAVESHVTPKRLVFKALVDSSTPEMSEEKRGPKLEAPEKSLQGFLKSLGKNSADELIKKDGYFYAQIIQPSILFEDVLPDLVKSVIDDFRWPKVMRYPQSSKNWVRPVRSLFVLWDGQSIPLKIDGFDLGNSVTYPHSRISDYTLPDIKSYKEYHSFLSDHDVVLDQEDRRKNIKDQLEKLGLEHGLVLCDDEKLLDEVVGLVEKPYMFIRKIDDRFMRLPECVLTTSMRVHQKYFAFRYKETQKLAPYYGLVTNYMPKDPHQMLKNFDKILVARLSDSLFFYDTDLKKPLIEHAQKYKNIIFHQKLGTLQDKISRLKRNKLFSDVSDLERAIDLSKADLQTEMVSEFPVLQGKMGAIYAAKQGEEEELSSALEEYYRPQSVLDDLPENEIGGCLSLIDKIDTLVGFIGVGFMPTGSKDPFALRRGALSLVRLLMMERFQNLDLRNVIQSAINTYENVDLHPDAKGKVEDFILERFFWLLEEKYTKNVVHAVLSINGKGIVLADLEKRITALYQFLQTEKGEVLKKLYKRCLGVLGGFDSTVVSEKLLECDEEKDLFQAIQQSNASIESAYVNKNYLELMDVVSSFQERLSAFFDRVMVNVENQELKRNRLGLLKSLVIQIQKVADLSYVI